MEPELDRRVLDQILSLCATDPGFFVELVDTYERSATQHLVALRGCVDASDLEGTRQRAHALKGSSRNIGASGAGKLAAAIEEAAVAGRAAADGSVEALVRVIEASIGALRRVGANPTL